MSDASISKEMRPPAIEAVRSTSSSAAALPQGSDLGCLPLTRLYQITHGSGGWEKLQEWSDGGVKRQSEERTNGSGADGSGGDEASLGPRPRAARGKCMGRRARPAWQRMHVPRPHIQTVRISMSRYMTGMAK